jgi:hypothetical protein
MDHRKLFAIRGCLELSIMMTSALCGLQNFRVSGYDINAADGILFAVNTNGLAVVRAAVIGRKRKAADTECALVS